MNDVAAQRDRKDGPQRLAQQPKGKDEGEAESVQPQGYTDLLIRAIPVEPLALYTFLVAGIVTTIKEDANQHLTMRWVIFGVSAGFIVAWMISTYLRRPAGERARKLPWAEVGSAVVAFCAWGLVMPESPLAGELSSQNQTIWTFIITAVGAGALGLLTGTLKKPSKKATESSTEDPQKAPGSTPKPGPEPNSGGWLAALGAAAIAAADAFHARRAGGGDDQVQTGGASG
jgi:hypothetical protein